MEKNTKDVKIQLAKAKHTDFSQSIIFWPLRMQQFQGLRRSKRLQQLKKALDGSERPQDSITLRDFRALLTEERAKMLVTIKEKKPESLYGLSKLLARDFKTVKQDIALLDKFGLIKLEKIIRNNRHCLKPTLAIEKLNVSLEV